MSMKYEIRKWCVGERTDLKLFVTDAAGRVILTTADYDTAVAMRDRLNAGAPEPQELDFGQRWAERLKDGTVKVHIERRPAVLA